MSTKRALVVDDSKSARLAMKRMLKRYDLKVDFAESGEDALQFLEHSSTDVIFMDHTMPGMDGLEAVSAIKSNPRTAMIPVMMYTAKEGDVYVSQARALGALAVLPKEVQPGVLFDMLLKLGLVEDRRDTDGGYAGEQVFTENIQKPSTETQPVPGSETRETMESLQDLISHTLEKQHLHLRNDILNAKKDFAHRVSKEILDQQRTEHHLSDTALALESQEAESGKSPNPNQWLGWGSFTLLLLIAVIWSALGVVESYEQTQYKLKQIANQLEQTNNTIRNIEADSNSTELDKSSSVQYVLNAQNSLAPLEWALNENNHVPFDELAYDQNRARLVQNLILQLATLNFTGNIFMEAHLGEFCLIRDNAGEYQLAPPDLEISECDLIGHPKDQSNFIGEHQSIEFINFIDTFPLLSEQGISVTSIAYNRQSSTQKFSFAPDIQDARTWNQVAARNNRIVYRLISDKQQ
ncbi:MAG: response regulator [Pseudomonadales bacterium]|nr:response regulator [Pseudomonadales bacterium]